MVLHAATVVRRVIRPPTAPTSPSVTTVTKRVTLVESAQSLVTVSSLVFSFDHIDANIPRDSRVTCSNCKEKGHTKVRCKKPVPEEDQANGYGGDAGGYGGDTGAADNAAGGDTWGSGGGGGEVAVSGW